MISIINHIINKKFTRGRGNTIKDDFSLIGFFKGNRIEIYNTQIIHYTSFINKLKKFENINIHIYIRYSETYSKFYNKIEACYNLDEIIRKIKNITEYVDEYGLNKIILNTIESYDIGDNINNSFPYLNTIYLYDKRNKIIDSIL